MYFNLEYFADIYLYKQPESISTFRNFAKYFLRHMQIKEEINTSSSGKFH